MRCIVHVKSSVEGQVRSVATGELFWNDSRDVLRWNLNRKSTEKQTISVIRLTVPIWLPTIIHDVEVTSMASFRYVRYWANVSVSSNAIHYLAEPGPA